MKNKSIKSIFCALFLICIGAQLSARDVEYIHPFALNPVNDGILLGAGTLLSGSAFVCDKFLGLKQADYEPGTLRKADIITFDQIFMNDYNKPLHILGTGTAVAAALAPAVFVSVPKTEWLGIGVMYGETLLVANGVKEWLKILVDRPRPYMYYEGFPESKVEDGDWNCSFPSGHSTIAFASAAFTSYLFNMYYPDSSWRYAVTGASFGLAAITAGLRMASGNHFFSDVMTGALIGTLCGFVIPYMHTESFYKKFQKSKNTTVTPTPLGFNVQVRF